MGARRSSVGDDGIFKVDNVELWSQKEINVSLRKVKRDV